MCQSPDLPVNANRRADLSTGAGSVLALGRPQLLHTLHLQPLRRQARSRVHQVAQDHQLPTQGDNQAAADELPVVALVRLVLMLSSVRGGRDGERELSSISSGELQK